MKRIVVHIPYGGGVDPFQSLPEHTGGEPFIVLRDRLAERGYEIMVDGRGSIEGCEWVFVFDVHPRDYPQVPEGWLPRLVAATGLKRTTSATVPTFYERCLQSGVHDRLVLFLWEPPVVVPENYAAGIHQRFAKVLTWHDGLTGEGGRYVKFCWPQTATFPAVVDVPYGDRKLLVNFSGNKTYVHRDELYSARKRSIRHFETMYPELFDLYGPGWDAKDEPPFPSWKGVVPHKWQVYPRYRFGLCYENMSGAPGWISEKIFDCMRAGCVPVYLGAPNASEYLEPGSYVDRSRFASDAELAEFLLSMPEREWQGYRAAADAFLAGPKFKAFLPDAFARTVMAAIGA